MRSFGLAFLSLTFVAAAQAQFTCSARPISPTSVRLEGYTELLGDVTFTCTGGTPAGTGVAIGNAEIRVTLNIPVTNRKNAADSYVDALLLVDEPHSVSNPNTPLTLCGAPGVDCAITGTGNGIGVYSGASNRPNVFQGEIFDTNTIRFRLPIDIPANGSQRIFRIVNLRGDGTQMVGRTPNAVTATVSVASVNLPATIIGISHPGIRFVPKNERFPGIFTAQLSGCTPINTAWAANQEGEVGPEALPSYRIPIREGSPGAWRPRNSAQMQTAGRWGGPVSAGLANLVQNVSGFYYGTESGFFNGPGSSPVFPVPSIPASTQFPAVRGMERAGAADFGTRILFRMCPQAFRSFSPSRRHWLQAPVEVVRLSWCSPKAV
jgi:hypothetical protein